MILLIYKNVRGSKYGRIDVTRTCFAKGPKVFREAFVWFTLV